MTTRLRLKCGRTVTLGRQKLVRCFEVMNFRSIWYCTEYCKTDEYYKGSITIIDDYDSHGVHRSELPKVLNMDTTL